MVDSTGVAAEWGHNEPVEHARNFVAHEEVGVDLQALYSGGGGVGGVVMKLQAGEGRTHYGRDGGLERGVRSGSLEDFESKFNGVLLSRVRGGIDRGCRSAHFQMKQTLPLHLLQTEVSVSDVENRAADRSRGWQGTSRNRRTTKTVRTLPRLPKGVGIVVVKVRGCERSVVTCPVLAKVEATQADQAPGKRKAEARRHSGGGG